MTKQLTYLNNNDLISSIDRRFADYIQEISGTTDSEIHLAAALASWSTRNGNVCLDLNKISDDPAFNSAVMERSIAFPKLNTWIDQLSKCKAFGKPGEYTPLILDSHHRLYFYRYWEYEKHIADAIIERIQSPVESIDYRKLKESVNRIFVTDSTSGIDKQKQVSICAMLKKFCVISGGPGTGKTTTVAKILAVLIEQAGENGIRIVLCAPTGKAAASLSETIRNAKATIRCDNNIKNSMPDEAFTIHRLLKNIPGSPYFRHNKDNPIHADVVIIDEASMVDVALMAKLMNAVPKEARVLLVGDKDQLSSVEAGSVLGDICNRDSVQTVSPETAEEIHHFLSSDTVQPPKKLEQQKIIQEHIIILDKNYRFDEHSGIGGLSVAVNKGDSDTGLRFLTDPKEKGISLQDVYDRKLIYQHLREKVLEKYSQYLSASDPYHAIERFNQFKILCALRSGPFGVDTINQLVQTILQENGLIQLNDREPDPIYKGRPILITRNDYSVGLFNGDTGIIMPESGTENGELHAVFPITKDEVREVPIHRLPSHETVYAMTIHKSQGSEFNDVLIILPDTYYPILTRELMYTGITRAINSVTIWGKKEVLKQAITNKIERTSGLTDALWGA